MRFCHVLNFFNFNLIEKDNEDNKFVDCAISANAICIIPNDNHFKVLKKVAFPKVNLLTLTEFDNQYKIELF